MMNETYGYRTGLTAGDIATLQALYGARTPDAFEGAYGNNTLAPGRAALPGRPAASTALPASAT